jgi:nicotinate-nucleotide pyrophosphorylase (carboxylating)
VNWILLDNHTPEELRESVRRIRAINSHMTLEASGGIRLSNVRDIAASGVNCISVGELTHSPRAVDISLELRKQ